MGRTCSMHVGKNKYIQCLIAKSKRKTKVRRPGNRLENNNVPKISSSWLCALVNRLV
jgi:hypothetical protein